MYFNNQTDKDTSRSFQRQVSTTQMDELTADVVEIFEIFSWKQVRVRPKTASLAGYYSSNIYSIHIRIHAEWSVPVLSSFFWPAYLESLRMRIVSCQIATYSSVCVSFVCLRAEIGE